MLIDALGIPILPVVGLTIDGSALTIQLSLQVGSLARAEIAVRSRAAFVSVDSNQPCFKPPCFEPGQLAAADSSIDAMLLAVLARVDPAVGGHRHRARAENKHDQNQKTENLFHTPYLSKIEASVSTLDKTRQES